MKAVKQKHPFGCGIACLAFILKISYQSALKFLPDGEVKAKKKGFLCKELISVLQKSGLEYEYKYVNQKTRNKIYRMGTIVFIKRSKRFPAGHYLCRLKGEWMDSWINFPNKNIKAGFRKRLPEKPIYAILAV